MNRLIIPLLLAIFLVLITGCSGEERSKSAALKEMKKMHQAAEKYNRDYGRWPNDVEELVNSDFYFRDVKVHQEWEFEFAWPNEIVGYSTEEMPGGPDVEISYEVDFSSY